MIDITQFSNKDELLKSDNFEVFNFNETDILKGKKMPIGTISNGFKKVAEGKWQKVSEYGMTKKEHLNERDTIANKFQNREGISASEFDEKTAHHDRQANRLDDKEYDDSHFEEKQSKWAKPSEDDEKGYGSYRIDDHQDAFNDHIEEMKNAKDEDDYLHHKRFAEINFKYLKNKHPKFDKEPENGWTKKYHAMVEKNQKALDSSKKYF